MAEALSTREQIKIAACLAYVCGSCLTRADTAKANAALFKLLTHIETLEALLDEADHTGAFGPVCWRYRAGISQ